MDERLSQLPAQLEVTMARALSGTVKINGTDDENWPFSDETTERISPVALVLNADQGATSIGVPPVRWGGECRVEVDVTATMVTGGDIQINGKVRLYEGVSEDSQDLAEEKAFSFIVPRNHRNNLKTTTHSISVSNSGLGGGDHAEIGFALTNYIVEEE